MRFSSWTLRSRPNGDTWHAAAWGTVLTSLRSWVSTWEYRYDRSEA